MEFTRTYKKIYINKFGGPWEAIEIEENGNKIIIDRMNLKTIQNMFEEIEAEMAPAFDFWEKGLEWKNVIPSNTGIYKRKNIGFTTILPDGTEIS